MRFPCEVYKLSIGADGDELGTQLFEAILLLCQSSEFGRSDEGEIGGIEEPYGPLPVFLVLIEAHRPEIILSGVVGRELEIGNTGTELEPAPVRRLCHSVFLLWLDPNREFPRFPPIYARGTSPV